MSNPGWYPDPGGQPGKFRYWDGSAWSAQLTGNPQDDPPAAGSAAATPPAPGERTRNRKWWLAGLAALVAIGAIIWLVVRFIPGQLGADTPWDTPNGHASANLCTAGVQDSTAEARTTVDGRMTAGHLSTPLLGDPWQAPEGDNRVPFGTYAVMQEATDQDDYDGKGNRWVSSVLLSDLISGDGFANAKAASETVMKCVLGLYYGNHQVERSDLSAQAHSVDGHDGWLIESQLSFDIPGLVAKGERAILLVVQTGTDTFGLFYASVPDTQPDRLVDARRALADLRVEK